MGVTGWVGEGDVTSRQARTGCSSSSVRGRRELVMQSRRRAGWRGAGVSVLHVKHDSDGAVVARCLAPCVTGTWAAGHRTVCHSA